jgi:hypothetical protein
MLSQDTEFCWNTKAQGRNDTVAVLLLQDRLRLGSGKLGFNFCNSPCYRHLGCIIKNWHISKDISKRKQAIELEEAQPLPVCAHCILDD